ncbi:MAG TPA: sigma-70 family RNA polymerase sigma factor, partial [Burkholderiaceae bacterium]|nr:sigma-70 family RNA polymerase sigma factor [Burkholderiaceae bacterium]
MLLLVGVWVRHCSPCRLQYRGPGPFIPAGGNKISAPTVSGGAGTLPDEEKRSRFARLVLPHMDAAMGLARWLLRDSASAEDAVQEAYLRAFRFFHSLRGENARPWLLGIVRNTCLTLLEQERQNPGAEFDEAIHGEDSVATGAVVWLSADPEASAIARSEREQVQRCLRALPVEYREVIVLRELHGCSYQE